MAVTRLKRKARKNKLRSKLRIQKLALLSAQPVIKNVDIEALKEEFKKAPAKAPKAETAVDSTVKEEKKATPKKEVVKLKVEKTPAKKADPKKEA